MYNVPPLAIWLECKRIRAGAVVGQIINSKVYIVTVRQWELAGERACNLPIPSLMMFIA
jgi:hypothetical protein